jgi:hypothetical protein
MSAFICEEVLSKKGFDGVLKMVYSGKDGSLFFENLKTTIDVDENNFHQTILKLIKG